MHACVEYPTELATRDSPDLFELLFRRRAVVEGRGGAGSDSDLWFGRRGRSEYFVTAEVGKLVRSVNSMFG